METGTPEAERDGLLLCITGEGKGKTTSALGMALRSLGWGRRVAVVQFIKGKFETGELRYFRKHHPEVLFEPKGLGLTRAPGDHAGAARAAWESVRPMLTDDTCDLLILDEFNVALSLGFLDASAVAALTQRRRTLDVVVTGRGATPELKAAADLVSVIAAEKHPFERGIPAKRGIDF